MIIELDQYQVISIINLVWIFLKFIHISCCNCILTTTADLDNLEFKIIKETWNDYELKDGTKIRGRMFITRIAENKNSPIPKDQKPGEQIVDYSFSFGKHFEVFSPKDQIGEPTPIPPLDQISEDKKIEVDPLLMSEPWNIYEIIKNGTIIKAKLVVSEIFKVNDIFDKFGQPYYILKNGPVFDAKLNTDKKKFAWFRIKTYCQTIHFRNMNFQIIFK